ncbi:hypothetical protein DL766_007398 [Monosporascus sp. MC13-8B]|uniref:Profilin n=1 Tax=Monosporascus cannonballus TaxID=155416 RepID=A0ABY0HD99_9PEZI|nr:hypothetical protein DL763_008230 [Monosporascus cannonballus]RYO90455.1 hypothetical protein DL762_002659 [Monosporascus cannonballus]RYP24000.1 hypothetical protein DL766_007398 [Monosporascus sp. MC13-8B]
MRQSSPSPSPRKGVLRPGSRPGADTPETWRQERHRSPHLRSRCRRHRRVRGLLTGAKGVRFGGGRQWRLVDAYAGTLREKLFQKVLKWDGVIGWISAGLSIQGSFLALGDTRNNRAIVGGHQQGFGFARNIAMDQHVLVRNRQFDMFDIPKVGPELLRISIDENTAVIVSKNDAEIFGASYVTAHGRKFRSRKG